VHHGTRAEFDRFDPGFANDIGFRFGIRDHRRSGGCAALPRPAS
jgi:hypothetical protein